MNTPQQQAELYRKAAETIEMCAEHGIEVKVKYRSKRVHPDYIGMSCEYGEYEFPIAVVEGQLVWDDTIVYTALGRAIKARYMRQGQTYTLAEPKQPLCEVELKPVYKGDEIYDKAGNKCKASHIAKSCYGVDSIWSEKSCFAHIENCTWNPPKRTVMVEFLVEDVEYYANERRLTVLEIDSLIERRELSCRKALDNLKGDKS